MTQEEKAKAYDEALKQAKFYHGNCPSEPERKKLEKMFPVLHESEDEQVRKWLIVQMSSIVNTEAVKELDKDGYEMARKAIIYLEKQKDSVSNAKYIEDVAHAFEDGRKKGIEEEQKPAEWREKIKQTTKNIHPEEYPSSLAECILPREYGLFKQLQQDCIETIEQELYSLGKEYEKDYDPRIKFLKSLRPHWKPSEEQIRTLGIVISDYRHACTKDSDKKAEVLKPLLEQLRKL